MNAALATLAIAAVPAFVASVVEWVEAFTIVLAVGNTRGWRSPIWGTIGGLGFNTVPFAGGYQGQTVPQQFLQGQGNCVGCAPGMQQLVPNSVAFQGGFGQVLPQQPWFNTTYGTW